MKILVTGTAGFIGFHLTKQLLQNEHEVVGLDNINRYYDVKLKFARLQELGILRLDASAFNVLCEGKKYESQFRFIRMNVEDRKNLPRLFRKEKFDIVCHLAAQAGVRFSINNPEPYVDSNIVGFSNILECSRNFGIKHFIYASSSSVYGLNKEIPFSENQKVESPISLYAATKKSNELIAHSYSHLFNLPTTGLRFFTVYGPWGRPDMALFIFTEAILNSRPIKVFNNGLMERDFTYIDDISKGVCKVIESPTGIRIDTNNYYKIYNIGSSKSVKLLDFIETVELCLDKKAKKELMPIQPGDVLKTRADISDFKNDYGYQPEVDLSEGVEQFVKWYIDFYT